VSELAKVEMAGKEASGPARCRRGRTDCTIHFVGCMWIRPHSKWVLPNCFHRTGHTLGYTLRPTSFGSA